MKIPVLYQYLLATSVVLALTAPPLAAAENPIVGFNRVKCPAKSDTFVSVPLMRLPITASKTLASAPILSNGQATLTPAEATEWAANEFQKTHYVRFTAGALAGHWYEIVGNTARNLTIDLNGEAGASFAPSDAFMVVKFWTLDTLFPPGSQKTFHTSTGNQRKSELLIPNVEDVGINLPAKDIYFLTSEGWKQSIEGYPYAGSRVLPPGLPLIIRHPAGVTTTNFEPVGRVLYSPDSIVLNQDKDKPQDNTVAIFRPVDVRLVDSDLDETVFSSSSSHESGARRDELLLFDNRSIGYNKRPSAIFYKYSQTWFLDKGKVGKNPRAALEKLSASGAFIIRKPQGSTSSIFWKNLPNY